MEHTTNGRVWVGIGIAVLAVLLIAYLAMGGRNSASQSQPANTDLNSATATTSVTATASTGTGTQGRKPVVKTIGFSSVSSTTAVIVGTVVPEGAETTYWFEYGPTMNFGSTVDARSAGAGAAALGAAGYISGLKPATEYYFRIGAQNAYGRSYGDVYKLITDTK